MTTYSGKDGQIKVSSNLLGELRSFNYTVAQATMDDSELSDQWDSHLAGSQSWQGEATAWFYDGDTAQAALLAGVQVALGFYPRGSGSGKPYHSGNATVTSIVRTNARNAAVEITFSFQGSGELAGATV